MHDPQEPHLTDVKQILWYLGSTLTALFSDVPHQLSSSSTPTLTGQVMRTRIGPPSSTSYSLGQPRLMIAEVVECGLLLEHRGRISNGGKWCG